MCGKNNRTFTERSLDVKFFMRYLFTNALLHSNSRIQTFDTLKLEYFKPYLNHRKVGVSHLRALQKTDCLKSIHKKCSPRDPNKSHYVAQHLKRNSRRV